MQFAEFRNNPPEQIKDNERKMKYEKEDIQKPIQKRCRAGQHSVIKENKMRELYKFFSAHQPHFIYKVLDVLFFAQRTNHQHITGIYNNMILQSMDRNEFTRRRFDNITARIRNYHGL